jgi:hypothetical protein
MAHRRVRIAIAGSAAVACLMAGMLVGVLAAGGSVSEVLAVQTRTVSTAVTRLRPTTVTRTAYRAVTVRRGPPRRPKPHSHRHKHGRGHHEHG